MFVVGYFLLQDFGLPWLALEGTGIGETFHRVWFLFRTQTGAVLFYVLMRFLLQSAGTLVTYLALLLGGLVLALPLGALALLLWLGLRHAGKRGACGFGGRLCGAWAYSGGGAAAGGGDAAGRGVYVYAGVCALLSGGEVSAAG